ncbi:DUF5069 domain-containing protein [Verrucomicrobiaceae bacterium 5K15]|uniref:DUF5069 domain-containing protein n=1 Tax=Oceaniferula flava TaxID=2800421 RepID=A0AAE2SBA4_9BACT|nr:DUF5069 domain-containing protein [Oceaniferula flavus]MBK1854708.1 DUF5069 domain-containing protein [Oceaniferula flavus]MBM1136014.1 DUF5069 domain-containing protein [Oceaniferula flavus]
MSNEKVKLLAKDLSKEFPRSPRETIAGYVVATRTLDKCRAVIAGTADEYHYDCPLDQVFFDFTELDADKFKAFVAEGATDAEVADYIQENAKKREKVEIVKWNNSLRYKSISDMPENLQEFLEDYIEEYVPKHRPVYVWFDVYDLEEGRI